MKHPGAENEPGPGEPWIPVDGYRDIVRTEAAAMGIPLRDPSLPRNGVPSHRDMSGVYVICERDADDDLIVVCVVDQARPIATTPTRRPGPCRR